MRQANNPHLSAQAASSKGFRLNQDELLGILKCAAEDRGITPATLIRLLAAAENSGRDPDPGPTVREWVERHIARKAVNGAKESDRGRKVQLKKLTARYGDVPLREFSRQNAIDFKDWTVCAYRPASALTILGLVKSAFGDAVEAGLLHENPFLRVKLPKALGRERFLSREECRVLIGACATFPEWLRDFIVIALDSGMRRNEILTLERRDVHLEMGTHGALGVRIERAKSKKSRVIPMTPRVREIVDKLLLNAQAGPSAILLSRSIDGGAVSESMLKYYWQLLCRKTKFGNLRVHDLRHTFASHLAQSGVGLAQIQVLLGHASPTMTLRYAHLNLDSLVDAMKALGDGRKGVQL